MSWRSLAVVAVLPMVATVATVVRSGLLACSSETGTPFRVRAGREPLVVLAVTVTAVEAMAILVLPETVALAVLAVTAAAVEAAVSSVVVVAAVVSQPSPVVDQVEAVAPVPVLPAPLSKLVSGRAMGW